jgi:phage baseplate assembly protein W
MAVLLGNKIVKDTEKYQDYAIGISLPIQIGNTAFNQTFTTSEQIKYNIKNLLLTKKGERIMQPEFGSGLQELLFDFNDSTLATKIEDVIVESVDIWLPYVTIQQIDVESSNLDKDNNTVGISITFNVLNNPDLNVITFRV